VVGLRWLDDTACCGAAQTAPTRPGQDQSVRHRLLVFVLYSDSCVHADDSEAVVIDKDWQLPTARPRASSPGLAVGNAGPVRARRKSLVARVATPEAIWNIIADPVAEQLLLASENLNTWDAFALARATKHRPLATFALWCLNRSGLLAHFNIPEDRLTSMMTHVESDYPDNPYHNRVHATDVMRSVHFLLTATPPSLLDEEQRLALYIGAAAHDVEHGGVTNSFLCATNVRLPSSHSAVVVHCLLLIQPQFPSNMMCRTSLRSHTTTRLLWKTCMQQR
jgi:3'5'-cyclic nucleotide phosphodiesterase